MGFWSSLLRLFGSRPKTPRIKEWYENLSVFGVAENVAVKATLRVDDGTSYVAARDANESHPLVHRLFFTVTSPPTSPGWGGYLTVEADGYLTEYDIRVTIGGNGRDHELTAVTLAKLPPPKRKRRTGIVQSVGRVTVDDQGPFHPLGLSFFWAMQGWKHERDRMKRNAEWIAKKGFDYVRILCEVGWYGRDIDPTRPEWADYDIVLAEVIDYLYDELGLRVQLTILGKGTNVKPVDLAARVANVVAQGREHKVIFFEMCNEYALQGAPILTMVQMAKVVRDRCMNLIALSAPGSWDDLRSQIGGPVNAFTVHIDRNAGDGGWRQVRQGYDFKGLPCFTSSNEPPGPASSVATNSSPLQLAMMRAVGVMCGAAAYVLHTGTGVFGDGIPHPYAGPRPANFWEIENIDEIVAAVRGIDPLLPEGVEHWQVANTGWTPPNPVAPFQPHAYWEGVFGDGVNKAYSAIASGSRFIQMPCGVRGRVTLRASYPLSDVSVFNPLTRETIVSGRTFDAGAELELPGAPDAMVAYVILGRRA